MSNLSKLSYLPKCFVEIKVNKHQFCLYSIAFSISKHKKPSDNEGFIIYIKEF